MDNGLNISIDELVDSKQATPKIQGMIKELLHKIKDQKMELKEALGFSNAFLESAYTYAYNMFKNGQYRNAIKIFSFLRDIDDQYRYSFAIAACHHYLKEYNEAWGNYLICTNKEPLNPIPYFHMADCLEKNNLFMSAIFNLRMAIELAARDPIYKPLRERAILEYKAVKKMFKKHVSEQKE